MHDFIKDVITFSLKFVGFCYCCCFYQYSTSSKVLHILCSLFLNILTDKTDMYAVILYRLFEETEVSKSVMINVCAKVKSRVCFSTEL